MAQRRMFNKTITNNDNFLEMPDSSQNLYFHLSMNADDDGFVDNWKSIIRMTGHKEDDLKILIAKQYIIPFESGVIVIRHWRLNNYLQKDRITPTNYKEEKALLTTDLNNVYNLDTKCIHSIDKNSIDKNSIDKNSIDKLSVTTTNIYSYIEKELCRTLSQVEIEMIDNWLSLFEEDIIKYAVQIAILSNKKNFKYINGIIKNWKSANYSTLEEIKDNEYQKKESKPVDEETLKLLDVDWLLEE